MASKRGAEIEKFYWLIINLLGKVFGFLLLLGGGLFLLGLLSELLRTGAMSWDGRSLTSWHEQWPVLLGGSLIVLFGGMLVKILPIKPKNQEI